MNIGIDATGMGWQKGGAAFYVINIIRALAELDTSNRYIVFCSDKSRSALQGLPAHVSVHNVAPNNVALRLIWEQTILPFYLCPKYRVDVLFGPNYIIPLFGRGFGRVVAIHDLSFFPLAELYPRSRRLFRRIIRWSVMRADRVLAISHCTGRDIARYIGDYHSKVQVAHLAAEERFKRGVVPSAVAGVRMKYGIGDGPYLFYLGFLEPRKNIDRLLRAFAAVTVKIPHRLVIAGGKGWWFEKTFGLAEELGLGERVRFTGYVSDEDVPALYAGAELFVFPSLYEGFGIAALEAISCGTPALVSDNSALPEVVGEAGVLVDPFDIPAISRAIEDLLADPGRLKRLREQCGQVARKFSWKLTGQKTLEAIRQAGVGGGS